MKVGLLPLVLLFAGCLGTNPPGPPTRWFDPTPPAPAAAAPTGLQLAVPMVVAAPHLGQPFAIRVGEREFVFDELHQWVQTPDRLVATALDQQLFGTGRFAAVAGVGNPVRVSRFELDVTSAPTAIVELRVSGSQERVATGSAAARSRQPEDVAAAMALALAAACDQALACFR